MTLFKNKPKRFFAFGCSFTGYSWAMWPEIIKSELGDVEYHNYGISGASNEYIAYMFRLADIEHKFNADDLIMICWTSAFRNDWYVMGEIILEGNCYFPGTYNTRLTPEYMDTDHYIIRDAKNIANITNYLDHLDSQSYQFAMIDNFAPFEECFGSPSDDIYEHPECKPYIGLIKDRILPSFEDAGVSYQQTHDYWHNNIINSADMDYHPQPVMSLKYLENIFDYEFSDHTRSVVEEYQKRLSNLIVLASSTNESTNPYLSNNYPEFKNLINFLD